MIKKMKKKFTGLKTAEVKILKELISFSVLRKGLPKKPISILATVFYGLTSIGLIVAYFTATDKFCKWISDLLVAKKVATVQIILLIPLLIFLFLLTVLFNALYLLRNRDGKVNSLYSQITSLEKLKAEDTLPNIFGYKYSRAILTTEIDWDGEATEKDIYEVVNKNKEIYHLTYTFSSTRTITRGVPIVEINNLPKHTKVRRLYTDEGGRRDFDLYFTPSIKPTYSKPVEIIIKEKIKGVYAMYEEELNYKSRRYLFDRPVEYLSYFCKVPTDYLELKVVFPLGYIVRERNFFAVRIGNTKNIHPEEEERIRTEAKIETKCLPDDGRYHLHLKLDKPIAGLSYFLCWSVVNKQEFDIIKKKHTFSEER